jgi:hypothetical protein
VGGERVFLFFFNLFVCLFIEGDGLGRGGVAERSCSLGMMMMMIMVVMGIAFTLMGRQVFWGSGLGLGIRRSHHLDSNLFLFFSIPHRSPGLFVLCLGCRSRVFSGSDGESYFVVLHKDAGGRHDFSPLFFFFFFFFFSSFRIPETGFFLEKVTQRTGKFRPFFIFFFEEPFFRQGQSQVLPSMECIEMRETLFPFFPRRSSLVFHSGWRKGVVFVNASADGYSFFSKLFFFC